MTYRERIIKNFEYQVRKAHGEGWDFVDVSVEDGYKILELLREQVLKEQEWYLLTEDADGIIHGLPGDDGQYLMTDGKDIWIDDYMNGVADGIFLDSGRDIREITAWMYLPKLPEERR